MHKFSTLLIGMHFLLLCSCVNVQAQDSSKIYLTTAVGLLVPVSGFSNAYKRSLALNSGIEYTFNKYLFMQFVLDFNAVKYDQQIKDVNSSYLFQNTSSSVFLAGINVGYNIRANNRGNFFISPYTGLGYANIGEPRVMVNNISNVVKQSVTRMSGVFAKGGLRIAYQTKSKILQTIYVDGSYWLANVKVQQSDARAVSLLIGTRIGF